VKKSSPFLLLMLGLLVGFPAARLVTPPAAVVPPAAADATGAKAPTATPAAEPGVAPNRDSEDCKPVTGPQGKPVSPHSWCDPVRLVREFFGLRSDPAKLRVDSLKEIVAAAKATDYDLRFMVALVPAPPDPRLDQALEAIQEGFAHSESSHTIPPRPDYLIDRVWLPWTGADAALVRSAQKAPGLMLFRGGDPRSLALVFLVAEATKTGIQKGAFKSALDLIAELQEVSIEPDVAILGPSFSGSMESLRLAIQGWRSGREGRPGLKLKAASGSATAKDLEEVFRDMDVSFCRTVLPDDLLHDEAFAFLSTQMGWDLRRVALLTESDTAYGQKFLTTETHEQTERGPGPAHQSIVLIPFPSHISDVRSAVEVQEKAQAQTPAVENPLQANHPVLDLDLSTRETSTEIVPTFSPITTYSNDLRLSNLMGTIAREGIRYVGIVATDVKDKLFLAEQVHRMAPDVVLFTFDNNLLYAYPQVAETTDGMLVFSSSPLFTQGAPWLPASTEDRRRTLRQQFSGEFQQGVFEAVRYLLGARPVPAPRTWISAVGNGSLWPIARLADHSSSPAVLAAAGVCSEPVPRGLSEESGAGVGSGFAGKDDLQILLVAVILYLLAIELNRAALLEKVPGAPVDPVPGNRRLLVVGALLLSAAAGFLLAVGSIPLWARIFTPSPQVTLLSVQWAYLIALTFAYAMLLRNAAHAAHGARVRPAAAAAWTLGGALALVLLVLGIWEFCVPGTQIQFFHLRARALASGLSPLISLSAVGGAVYVWLRSELLRRRLMVRLATDCPLDALSDPALAGSLPIVESFRDLLTRTFPRGLRPWALPLVAFGPPVFLLWWTVQPIGETKAYGRLFVFFLAIAFSLSALSFYRFVRLWHGTRRLLHRLDDASPAVAEAFKQISEELDWRPIKSFGWQMPPFRTLVLSAHKLRQLVEAGRLKVDQYPDSLDVPLKAMFEGEREGGSVAEIENRNRLSRIFAQACLDLRTQVDQPDVRQFLALRVTAYLRYIFAHMRNSLIGALTSWLLVLLGVTAYVFEPKHFVSLAGWLALGMAVTVIVWVFLQMDRNPTLSRVGGTTPGQVTFDRVFLTKLLTYIGIPVLGLIATQFPQVGRMLGQVVGQLLRIGGGG
jgi:hypothetical protein